MLRPITRLQKKGFLPFLKKLIYVKRVIKGMSYLRKVESLCEFCIKFYSCL